MKRFGKLVIGGLQSKIFNLILVTVLLLSAAFVAVSLFHSNMLSEVVEDSGRRQQAAVSELSGSVMREVVVQTLGRSNRTEARFADGMFADAGNHVAYAADRVAELFAHPEAYSAMPWTAPDPEDDGTWAARVILAGGVEGSDPALAQKLGLLANLSDPLVSLCRSFGLENLYVGLPEGAFFTVSCNTASWFENGRQRDYDPRVRQWYQQAAQAGGMIYTDGEWDANTGRFCVECAAPVLGADGTLQAVVGLDIYLDEIRQVLQSASAEGEFNLLVNQDGIPVLPMQAEAFPMAEADRNSDLRASRDSLLAGAVDAALRGQDAEVAQGQLSGGAFYLTASPIASTGWVLVSAFDQSLSDQPAVLLSGSVTQLQQEATETYREKSGRSRTTALLLFAAVTLLTLGGALALGWHIVKPLNTITQRISELREGNLEFRMEDAYRTGDEVEELARSFADLSHKTVEYLDTVTRVTAEKERIGAELSLATRIQASMLPHIYPAFPQRKEFDIYASMDPAREVGGDFYDYYLIDEDHLGLVIADVSGKGVPAALFMMATKIILQSVAMLGKSPAEILSRANEAICSSNEAQMFVTVWMGILEISTGKLTCASAGHEYPVLEHSGSKFALFKDRHGFVIGGMEGARYREYELRLEPGDRLFVYTDGLPEATSAELTMFGTERMVDALNRQPELPPREILQNVRSAVDDFVKDAEQFDDLTMLCLEYRGKQD